MLHDQVILFITSYTDIVAHSKLPLINPTQLH
jgi:hypothetical protein